RVAQRHVVRGERFLEHGVRAAEALRDRVPGELEVDAAGPDTLVATRREEALDLVHDHVEPARLDPRRGLEDVRVHRVTGPDDGLLGLAHGTQQRREQLADPSWPHPGDERVAAGLMPADATVRQFPDVVSSRGSAEAGADVDW